MAYTLILSHVCLETSKNLFIEISSLSGAKVTVIYIKILTRCSQGPLGNQYPDTKAL